MKNERLKVTFSLKIIDISHIYETYIYYNRNVITNIYVEAACIGISFLIYSPRITFTVQYFQYFLMQLHEEGKAVSFSNDLTGKKGLYVRIVLE